MILRERHMIALDMPEFRGGVLASTISLDLVMWPIFSKSFSVGSAPEGERVHGKAPIFAMI